MHFAQYNVFTHLNKIEVYKFLRCSKARNLEKRERERGEETSIPGRRPMNEVSVRSTPRAMSTGDRNRSKELLPPFESRHYNHK